MRTLLNYEQMPMRFFGDGEWEIKVKMNIEKKYFFNLFTKTELSWYTITMFDDIKTHTDHWDELIAKKLPLS